MNLSSVMFEKDLRQNMRTSSIDIPIPWDIRNHEQRKSDAGRIGRPTLRNRLYCWRPLNLRWWLVLSVDCKLLAHIGKCFLLKSLTMSAVINSPLPSSGSVYFDDNAPVNPVDKWSRTGRSRSSSSNRGKALAVISNPSIKRELNSSTTRLTCNDIGT
jgi:hypothetical protein